MKKLNTMHEDKPLTPRSDPVSRGLQKQFPIAKMVPLLVATFIFAMAGATVGQGVPEPVSVLYWDGSSLNVIGPTSGYVIPAGATYAIDEANGVALILAAMPGASSPSDGTVPGPNTSVPSITTPSGLTFQVPDAGNVSSIFQNGGSVTVTYNDGSTATMSGQYSPPGSPAPPAAPAETVTGQTFPDSNPDLVVPLENALLNDNWIPDFLGGAITKDEEPSEDDLDNSLCKNGVCSVDFDCVNNTPEPGTLTIFGLGLAAAGLRIRRRRA
jgi:hypothetical protein